MSPGGATRSALVAAGLDPDAVAETVRRALAEDLSLPGGSGADGAAVDVTSVATVPADLRGRAVFVPRAAGVVAGLPVAAAVLEVATDGDVLLTYGAADGDRVEAGAQLLAAAGPVRGLLTAERTALNLLCHLSGVATLTRRWVDAVAGTGVAVRDTRKTMPGLRALEKYAVRCGGGVNHRMSLADAALVKDNHVLAAGGVAAAFAAVRARFPGLPLEVECDTVEQVREVVAAGADLVLLDNMPPAALREAVAVTRAAGCRTEASGGLSLDTARAVAEAGVDFVAVGALTHSAPVLDIGMDLVMHLRAHGTPAGDGAEG